MSSCIKRKYVRVLNVVVILKYQIPTTLKWKATVPFTILKVIVIKVRIIYHHNVELHTGPIIHLALVPVERKDIAKVSIASDFMKIQLMTYFLIPLGERKVYNLNKLNGIFPPNHDGSDPCASIKTLEVVNCTNPDCDVIVPSYCYEDLTVSPCRTSDVTNYWFYDHMSDQCGIFAADKCDKNRNKFTSKEICEETCQLPRRRKDMQAVLTEDRLSIDCAVSEWHSHGCNATCGEGVQIKTRKVIQTPRYGGKPCPKHLVRVEKCYQRCEDIYSVSSYITERRRTSSLKSKQQLAEKSECKYSEWSAWTPCTATCGDAVRQKTRTLVNNEMSYLCKDRVRIEKCNLLPCLPKSNDNSESW